VADADLIRALRPFNTHWETRRASELVRRHPHRRRSFFHVRRRLDDLPFEIVAGPRQVGKTTLMGHLIDDLLASGHSPERA
jgi:uncharacterized protein